MDDQSLRRVLLIEDDLDIQLVARVALEEIGGFEVVAAGSGAEALEILESFAPELILLDVMMPEMDGIATLAELRRRGHHPLVPVVFMTAKAQPAEIAEYRRAGAADVIVKPFDPLTLGDTVRAIWERSRRAGSTSS